MADDLEGYFLPEPDRDTSMSPQDYLYEMTVAPAYEGGRMMGQGYLSGSPTTAALGAGLVGLGAFGLMPGRGTPARMMAETMPSPATAGSHMKGLLSAPQSVRDAYSIGAMREIAAPGAKDPFAAALGFEAIPRSPRVGAYEGTTNKVQPIEFAAEQAGATGASDAARMREFFGVQNAVPSLSDAPVSGFSNQGAFATRGLLEDEVKALANKEGLSVVDRSPTGADVLYWDPEGASKARQVLDDYSLNPRQKDRGSVYNSDMEEAWKAAGDNAGTGAVTRHFLDSMAPESAARLDMDPGSRAAVGRMADYDAASGFTPRQDIQNARRIYEREGLTGLRRALESGAVALPAAVAAVPMLYDERR